MLCNVIEIWNGLDCDGIFWPYRPAPVWWKIGKLIRTVVINVIKKKCEIWTQLFTLYISILCISANTRVIKQSSLQKFQEEMGAVQKDPYRVVMRQSKLPMSLLHDRVKAHVSIKECFILCGLYNGSWVPGRLSRVDLRCLCELTPFLIFIMRILAYKAIDVFTWLLLFGAVENHVVLSCLFLGFLWGEMNTRPHFNPHSILTLPHHDPECIGTVLGFKFSTP